MKQMVIVPDGLADAPLPELGGRTPLEAASTPHMNRLARGGTVGRVRTIPEGVEAGSEAGHLSLLGYDPRAFLSGRAAWEAKGQGLEVGPEDWVLRCNMITLGSLTEGTDLKRFHPSHLLIDYSGGGIRGEEARDLIEALNRALAAPNLTFHSGVDYRHLLLLRNPSLHGIPKEAWISPHRIVGQPVADWMPKRPDIRKLLQEAVAVLAEHPINRTRRQRRVLPANGIWFWGPGREGRLPAFQSSYGGSGAVITALDLLRGIGRSAGMTVMTPTGANGGVDTDLGEKTRAALEALTGHDLVYLHLQATDEVSHRKDSLRKVDLIERIDREVIGPIATRIEDSGDAVMVVTDHATYCATGEHGAGPVPFLWCRPGRPMDGDPGRMTEREAVSAGGEIWDGRDLLRGFRREGVRVSAPGTKRKTAIR